MLTHIRSIDGWSNSCSSMQSRLVISLRMDISIALRLKTSPLRRFQRCSAFQRGESSQSMLFLACEHEGQSKRKQYRYTNYCFDHSTCETDPPFTFSCSDRSWLVWSDTTASGPSNRIAISSRVGPFVSTNRKYTQKTSMMRIAMYTK